MGYLKNMITIRLSGWGLESFLHQKHFLLPSDVNNHLSLICLQPTPVLRSLFNAVQLGWILEKLRQLQSWMENNMQLMLTQLDGG